MNSFWTVVGFTVRNKIRAKAFLITTLVIALILSIGINLPYFFKEFNIGGGDKLTTVGYVQDAAGSETGASLQKHFAAAEGSNLELKAYADKGSADENEKQLKKAIADGEINGYLEFGALAESGFPEMTYKTEKLLEYEVQGKLQGALQLIRQESILKDAGLTAEQMALLNAPINIATVQISATEGAGSIGDGKTEGEQGVNMGIIYFMIILLFMAVMISGQLIASEITAEKSSRVMEILITSVAPLKQMFGKIFGMFVVVILQIAVYVAVIVINLSLPHNRDVMKGFNISLDMIDPMLLIYSLLFFLTGFFLFATMFAAVGSLVSRTEDLGQAVMPITILSLAGFYISIFSISSPDSMLVKVTSFIPFFSPFVMLLRLGLTDPPTWQVLTSIGILLVSIYISVWISAKIYRTGVLMYGKRPSWKEIRKAMKAYKV
ncbi:MULTISPECIES: ABC transporter permease [unclassified Paenibacillus]|uniref:ABC transporter permease n=1 Tax=unclassified Paenibacillus TaxID=185978 RepID=UPI002F3EB11F